MILDFINRKPTKLLVVMSTVVLFPIVGCSENLSPNNVPSVIDFTLGEALQKLEDKGFDPEAVKILTAPRNSEFNNDWNVCNQSPKIGESSASGEVKLLIAENCSVVNNDGTIRDIAPVVPPVESPVEQPAPVIVPEPEPAPEPAPIEPAPIPEPVIEAPAPAPVSGVDPDMGTCKAARAAGYGPYTEGQPEYAYYQDRDHDGEVCEDN